MNQFPSLTMLTLLPFIGGCLVLAQTGERARVARGLALVTSLIVLGGVLFLVANFNPGLGTPQFGERYSWIPGLGVEYHLGADGLSLLMVLLCALVVPMALLASWRIQGRAPLHFGLILFLQAGLLGTFTALNFFHWFLFWELSLIPAFFLIRLWGGSGRASAATQFFIYTMVGSVGLLLAFLAIFLATGTFDFARLAELSRNGSLATALSQKLGWRGIAASTLVLVIFAGAFLGFAVKVPLFPFHTWLPAAYSEAPTGTVMLLTGLMSKMGVYGFIRILLPIFPREMLSMLTPLLWLAVCTIVFSAGAALAQRDLKRMLAYSSINHLGYCLLGIFAVLGAGATAAVSVERTAALNGVFLQMFNHGLTASLLFWFVGMIEERSGGQRGLDDFGGLRKAAPVLCGLMGIALFSSLGLPGLNGFIGEFLIFKGVFALVPWAAALALPGLLITAVFILLILQRVFYGPLNERWRGFPDLSVRERVLVAPALGLMLVLGLHPQLVLGWVNRTAMRIVGLLP